MKRIVILNGFPQCGKDTFANAVIKRSKENGFNSYSLSTVDLVKDMLELAGIDREKKTPEDRKLMSDLKDLLTDHSNIPFNDVVTKIQYLYDGAGAQSIYLVMCREPQEIKKFKDFFKEECVTVFIDRKTDVKITNHADKNVEDFDYDVVVENNGTEESFVYNAMHFCDTIFD